MLPDSLALISLGHGLVSLEHGLDPTLVQNLLQQWGYGAIFGAMLLENAGLPLPGETVTLLGGYAAGSGQLNAVSYTHLTLPTKRRV